MVTPLNGVGLELPPPEVDVTKSGAGAGDGDGGLEAALSKPDAGKALSIGPSKLGLSYGSIYGSGSGF